MLNNPMTRRQLLQGMGASAGLLALAACAPVGPTASTGGSEGAAPSAEPMTVVLWSSFSGKNAETEALLVDMFKEAHGGEVTLDYQVQGNYEETAQR